MIEQLKTIREALALGIKAINHLGGAREAMPLHDALRGPLTQLEAMVGEPVAWCPISTAPRNGKNILLRFGQDGVSQGKMHCNRWHTQTAQRLGGTWLLPTTKPGSPRSWIKSLKLFARSNRREPSSRRPRQRRGITFGDAEPMRSGSATRAANHPSRPRRCRVVWCGMRRGIGGCEARVITSTQERGLVGTPQRRTQMLIFFRWMKPLVRLTHQSTQP